jgi:hypothetical protein
MTNGYHNFRLTVDLRRDVFKEDHFANETALGKLNIRYDAVFIAGLALLCGLSVIVGFPAPLGSFAHDTFFFLDNAYRVIQGQVPHRDFSSAWGPLTFLVHAAGLALSGMQPTGIGYANALFGAAVATWTYLIVRSRWSQASACALGLYAVLLVVAPFPIGNHPFDFGYAMVYNRYGYALLGIILVECAACVGLADPPARTNVTGPMSTGAALGLLVFLKISYAIVALGFVALTFVPSLNRTRRALGVTAGSVAVTVFALGYLHFDVSDMLSDLAIAATARGSALHLFRQIAAVDWVQNISMILFVVCAIPRASNSEQWLLRALFVLMTILAGYALLITNAQFNTFPLNAYAAVAVAASGWSPLTPPKWLTPGFPKACLVAICLSPFCFANFISLSGAAVERHWSVLPFDQAAVLPAREGRLLFRPLTGTIKSETVGADYVAALNDGLDLLRRHPSHDGVLTFDEFNPFNYLLNRPSPKGGFAAAAYNYIFCDAAHPATGQFFGNARYVMIRKYEKGDSDVLETGDVQGLMKIYGSALQSQYTLVEQTRHWDLWQRKALVP